MVGKIFLFMAGTLTACALFLVVCAISIYVISDDKSEVGMKLIKIAAALLPIAILLFGLACLFYVIRIEE